MSECWDLWSQVLQSILWCAHVDLGPISHPSLHFGKMFVEKQVREHLQDFRKSPGWRDFSLQAKEPGWVNCLCSHCLHKKKIKMFCTAWQCLLDNLEFCFVSRVSVSAFGRAWVPRTTFSLTSQCPRCWHVLGWPVTGRTPEESGTWCDLHSAVSYPRIVLQTSLLVLTLHQLWPHTHSMPSLL